MMRVIIFSRDRAMQVEATLRSLKLQTSDGDQIRVSVLYRATTDRHETQYRRLAEETHSAVHFVQEEDFRSQVRELQTRPGQRPPDPMSEPSHMDPLDYCLFVVDDTIFLEPLRLPEIGHALAVNRDALGFSLRLGRNTTYCYAGSRMQQLPKFDESDHGILKFRWVKADGDFGYPLELSSSVYRLSEISALIERLEFNDPSSLETQMSQRARDFARLQPALLCFQQSAAFSIPLNRVQEVYPNRAGSSPRFSTDRLADMFDQGKRIDLGALSGFTPNACHQEVELGFE